MHTFLKSIVILVLVGVLIYSCKTRKIRDVAESSQNEAGKLADKVSAKAGLGSFSFDGTNTKDKFRIYKVTSSKNIDARALEIYTFDVRQEKFEETFNYYPLILLEKSESAIYSEFRLCQVTCKEGHSVKDSFSVFDTRHISDFKKEVTLSLRACVEKEQAQDPDNNCGSWKSYRKIHKKPLFLKYQPDTRLTLLLAEEESIRDEIRDTGIRLTGSLSSEGNSSLGLAQGDETANNLRELGGHLAGEGLMSRAASYHTGYGQPVSTPDGCFTRVDHEKLSKEEQCRLSQYIGSGTAFVFFPPIKFYWEADMLCDGTLACTPDYGCAKRSRVRKYYANPGDQCIPSDSKFALQVGGTTLLVGGLLGVTGAAIGYNSVTKSSPDAVRNKRLAVVGGAVALTAIAVGIWNIAESNNYSLTSDHEDNPVARALAVTDSLAKKLQQQRRKISGHLAASNPQ